MNKGIDKAKKETALRMLQDGELPIDINLNELLRSECKIEVFVLQYKNEEVHSSGENGRAVRADLEFRSCLSLAG